MRLLDEQTKLLPISSEYYEALLADLEKYMQLVEQDVITIICDRLRKIGNMNPTSKKQISDLVRFYGADMDRIKKAIAKRLKISAEEVDLIFEQAATDSADFATALAMGRNDLIDTRRMELLAMAAAKRYKDYLLNLPDTFAFKVGDQLLPIRKAYIELTNQATLAVQSGALDYNTAIRNTVKRLADNGLQVINWESGYHRRADSSVRMNVMEGVRQLNQGLLDEAGKKFATGYELSAHDRPAPDHADIQGKQYTIEQFEVLNSGLKRPIGTLNCMHIAYPIIYGVTKPTYSEDELEEMKANSKKEYEWKGKKLDGYECTQKQRWYETEIRKSIDRENALKAAGDETGYRIEAMKTSKLRMEYKAFSQHVGLSEKLNRTGNASYKVQTGSKNQVIQTSSSYYGVPHNWNKLDKPDEENDMSAVNPNYGKRVFSKSKKDVDGDGYDINCVNCVATYELRQRKYDVTAKSKYDCNVTKKAESLWFGAAERAEKTTDFTRLENAVDSSPLNSRFFVGLSLNEYTGHAIAAKKTSNGVIYLDPQNNTVYNVNEIKKFYRMYKITFWRMDDLEFTDTGYNTSERRNG